MLLAAVAAVAICSSAPARAGELRDFEKQYSKPGAPAKAKAERRPRPLTKDEAQRAADVLTDGATWDLVKVALLLPLVPYALASSGPHLGFADRPYAGGQEAFAEGPRDRAVRAELSYQRVSSAVGGLGARLRVMTKPRVGLEGSWTRYRERYERVDINLAEAGLTGALEQGARTMAWFSIGGAVLSGVRARGGPQARLGFDCYPLAPLSLEAEAAVAGISGRALGEVRGSVGVEVLRLQLRAGYRSLWGPVVRLSGPEASLSYWF